MALKKSTDAPAVTEAAPQAGAVVVVDEKIRAQAMTIINGDSNGLMQLGRVNNPSSDLLSSIKTDKSGEIGEALTRLVVDMKSIKPEKLLHNKRSWLDKILGRTRDAVVTLRTQQQSVKSSIDNVVNKLKEDQQFLLSANNRIAQLITFNESEAIRFNTEAQVCEYALSELAKIDTTAMEPNKVSELNHYIARVEAKLVQVRQFEILCKGRVPMYHINMSTNSQEAQNIQDVVEVGIPSWEQEIEQLVLNNQTAKAQENRKMVTGAINESFVRNSELTKQNALAAAEAAGMPIITMETLVTRQNNLVATVNGVNDIIKSNSVKRKQYLQDMQKMDEEFERLIANPQQRI